MCIRVGFLYLDNDKVELCIRYMLYGQSMELDVFPKFSIISLNSLIVQKQRPKKRQIGLQGHAYSESQPITRHYRCPSSPSLCLPILTGKMDKRKDLSEFDEGQIVMARPLDQSISKTAALVGCSWSAVIKIKCSLFVCVGNVVDIYQREFLALRDRLHSAEQENLKRSKELNLVLDEIKRAIAEKQALRDINRTWSSLSDETKLKLWNVTSSKNVLQLPSIFHHLPHLLAKETSLQPAVHVGQGRTGVSIVMGVPSVKREVHSYLTDTLSSLMSELSQAEKDDCVIVVFIAETDQQYANSVADNLKRLIMCFEFSRYFQQKFSQACWRSSPHLSISIQTSPTSKSRLVTLKNESALTRRGMDSTRSLKVCCGIWHQDVSRIS
ncbi:hypothetical protein QTP86_032509 [Hemibagrus guttatus]|nr:hypothetical protein QTP86_032509 [Hemibagrus guttatus]